MLKVTSQGEKMEKKEKAKQLSNFRELDKEKHKIKMNNGIVKTKIDGKILILSRYFTCLSDILRKLKIS